jgi:hypothetical protein
MSRDRKAPRRGGATSGSRGGHVNRISILGRVVGGAGSGASLQDAGHNSVHFCGGCGAAFLVDGVVSVFPVDLDGTAREFCACCHDFLGARLPSGGLARTPGYDEEGQALNARFPALTPTGRRRHRARDTQFRLDGILRAYSSRSGIRQPDPLFTSG